MKFLNQKPKISINLETLVNDLDSQNRDYILFESKAYHASNYQSYLMLDYLFKISITNNDFKMICKDEFSFDLIRKFIIDQKLDYMDSDFTFTIRFKADHPFASKDEMIRNHPYFDIIRQLTEYLKHEFELAESFIFPTIFSYDLIDHFHNLDRFCDKTVPDFQFFMPKQLIYEDKIRQEQIVMTCEESYQFNVSDKSYQIDNEPYDDHVNLSVDDITYSEYINQAKRHIENGDVYQLVVSRSFEVSCPNPLRAYHELKRSNPSPYMFIVKDSDDYLFGASPERAVQFDASSREIYTSPIAGTKPRSFTESGSIDLDADDKIALELKMDRKEIAEHIMLVDLARNDIALISKPETRTVSRLMEIEAYSHVLHLVSEVKGELKDELDGFQAYIALMNMGTLTGSPKFRAYQLLREIEKQPRGYYGGSIGFLRTDGSLNTAIIIRSAEVKNKRASITAGAGVVHDSIIEREVQESENKAKAVINAIIKSHQNSEVEHATAKHI